jgi:hypothetical protein
MIINAFNTELLARFDEERINNDGLLFSQRNLMNQELAAIAKLQPNLDRLDTQLNNYHSQIRALNIELASYQVRNTVDMIDHLQHSDRHHHQSTMGKVVHFASDVMAQMRVNTIQNELANLNQARMAVQVEKSPVDSLMRHHQNNKNQIQQEIDRLHTRNVEVLKLLSQGSMYLFRLRNAPKTLCENLERTVTKFVQTYEEKHPAGQLPSVRLVLHELPKKMQALMIAHNGLAIEGHVSANVDSKRDWQFKYSIFCYLLLKSFEQVEFNGDDNKFKDTLGKIILGNVHIDKYGNFPNETSDETISGTLYQNFYAAQRMPERQVSEMDKIDLEYYQDTKLRLQATLDSGAIANVPKHVLQVAQTIVGQIESAKNKVVGINESKPDVKFYTNVLNKMNQFLRDPLNSDVATNFNAVIQHVNGHPGLGRTVAALLLTLTGLVIATPGVIVALAAFNVAAAPASAIGVALGASTAIKAASLSVAGLGLGTLFGGISLFGRHGLANSTHKLQQAAVKKPWKYNDPRPVPVVNDVQIDGTAIPYALPVLPHEMVSSLYQAPGKVGEYSNLQPSAPSVSNAGNYNHVEASAPPSYDDVSGSYGYK